MMEPIVKYAKRDIL